MESSDLLNYLQKFIELLDAREASGGNLSQDEESQRVWALDQIWWKLTEAEQAVVERLVLKGIR